MRLCSNETVDVYEVINPSLSTALREVADGLDELDDALYTDIHVEQSFAEPEPRYVVTVYVH